MTSLRFERWANPVELERLLRGASPCTKDEEGWTAKTKAEGLFIDMSRVEFAEFTTLAQVALLIEGAVRHGIRVSIATPRTTARVGEREYLRAARAEGQELRMNDLRRRIRNRAHAIAFMRRSGFLDVVRVAHVPKSSQLVEVIEDLDTGRDVSTTLSFGPERPTLRRHDGLKPYPKNVFRLRWTKTPLNDREQELSQYIQSLHSVLSFDRIGLTDQDAQAIAGTVIQELVENVCRWAPEPANTSCPPYALVGAIVLDQYRFDPDAFLPKMRPFAEWAARVRSPTVRIVVGDSGRGIPKTLGPYLPKDDYVLGRWAEDASHTERTLLWAFHRWSTSDPAAAMTKLNLRGLWRVQRLVRSYGGYVSARSEDALAGWSYGPDGQASAFIEPSLRYAVGTLLDVCFLTALPRTHPVASLTDTAGIRLSVIRLAGGSSNPLADDDKRRLISAFANASASAPECLIVVPEALTLTPEVTQRFLQQTFELASSIANNGAICLLLPTFRWRQIEGLFESFQTYLDERPPAYAAASQEIPNREPILVMDGQGVPRWFGGHLGLRSALESILSENTLSADVLDLAQRCGTTPRELVRWLRDQPDLVRLDGNIAHLNISAGAITSFLLSHVQSLIEESLERGDGIHVRIGKFRTPSLMCVDRWVNLPSLIESGIGSALGGYVVARLLEHRITDRSLSLCSIARLETVPPALLKALMSSLDSASGFRTLPVIGGSLSRDGAHSLVMGDSAIVLVDIVSSTSTLTQVLYEVFRARAEIVAICAIIDARSVPTDAIEIAERQIPFISVASRPSRISDSDDAENIDPVLREPSVELQGKSLQHYAIPEERLYKLCGMTNAALRLGHVERSRHRHFAAYANPEALLALEPFRSAVFEAIKDAIDADRSAGILKRQCQIWFPGGNDSFAAKLAYVAHGAFKEICGPNFAAPVRAVVRGAFQDRWAFPHAVPAVEANTVVYGFDWGALSATTIHQLMRLAAEAGASAVRIVILFSQMPAEEELALRHVSRVTSFVRPDVTGTILQTSLFEDQGDPLPSPKEVPASVTFLSRLGISFYDPAHCPLCTIRRQYAEEARNCPVGIVRILASNTQNRLRERDRSEIFVGPSEDLFGAPISTDDITAVLRLRDNLSRALRQTAVRLSVVKAQGDGDPDQAIAYVRLLSAEPYWLKLPPLCFDVSRTVIAANALAIATSDQHPTALRRQGIIVLRSASKARFIHHLPHLLRAAGTNTELVAQVLYDVMSYLHKEYHDRKAVLSELRNVVASSIAYVSDHWQDPDTRFDVLLGLRFVFRAVTFNIKRVGALEMPPMQAWVCLKSQYEKELDSHHDALSWMDYLVNFFDLPAGLDAIDEETYREALEMWENCLNFLVERVFPYIPHIATILLSDRFVGMAPIESQPLLHEILESSAPYLVDPVSQSILDLARDSLAGRTRHSECRQQLSNWNQLFFDPAESANVLRKGSSAWLLKILRGCPSELLACIDVAAEKAGKRWAFTYELASGDDAYHVFCDRDLLLGALGHVIENAAGVKHADPRRKHVPRLLFKILRMPDDKDPLIHLEVINSGTVSSAPKGRGFARWNASLDLFGGTLEGEDIDEEDWRYRARITLKEWTK